MVVVDEYFHDLMKKILNSYDIIKNLGDSKEDFFVLDVELTKINGLLRVLVRKSEEFSDKNIEYMELWREYFSINEQAFRDIYIDTLSLEESEYDLIQHEALSYQSKINNHGIEISKLTLEFMNIDVPYIEVFSNKLINNPLSFMRTS